MNHSIYLSSRQLKGLGKIGSILIPNSDQFPSFSEALMNSSIDTMIQAMNKYDRAGLKFILTLFSAMPSPLIKVFIASMHRHRNTPFFPGPIIRQILLGIKGVTYTSYYTKEPNSNTHSLIYQNMNWNSAIRSEKSNDIPYQDLLSSDLNPNSQFVEKIENLNVVRYHPPDIKTRVQILWQVHDWILDNMEHIIYVIQKSTGKTKNEILFTEIFSCLENIRWLTKNHKSIHTHSVPTPLIMLGKKSTIHYEPLGTVCVITAWNYPFYQAIQAVTASFLAGNQTLLKPSEYTPLKEILEPLQKILPKNSLYIFYGDGKTGEKIINSHPDKIFFTGSEETGRKILSQASQMLIPVELELGGKDPAIVLKDANISRAASGILWGSCVTSGQACSSAELVFIHYSVYNHFKQSLLTRIERVKVGDERLYPQDHFDFGPITNPQQITKIAAHVRDAIQKGATIISGSDWDFTNPNIPPIVIENVSNDMLIAKEETFGPIIPLISFSSIEEVIKNVNQSKYGLSASVWGTSKTDIRYITQRLQVGSISVNNIMSSEGNHSLPFGGYRSSGIGRHKGIHGLQAYTQIKSIMTESNSNKWEVNWFPATKIQFSKGILMLRGYYKRHLLSKIDFIINGLGLEQHVANNKKYHEQIEKSE